MSMGMLETHVTGTRKKKKKKKERRRPYFHKQIPEYEGIIKIKFGDLSKRRSKAVSTMPIGMLEVFILGLKNSFVR